MKSTYHFQHWLFSCILVFFSLTNCSPAGNSTNPQEQAIGHIRLVLEVPELPLQFNQMTNMLNSPTGGLEVTVYHDSDGRIYSVEPKTNQVVEIDARALLSKIPTVVPGLTQDELRAKAEQYIFGATPNFNSIRPTLTYEEGGKIDNYFFVWYGEIQPGMMNRPFAQIGFHKSGLLFAYYNTLLINQ